MAVKNGMKSKAIPEFRLLCILQLRHTSWEDAALVSLHGRWQNWIYEAEHHAKTFLLLGGRKENLKEKLLYYGLEDLTVHTEKNFSYPQEQIFSKTVSELTEEDTEGLCIVCLENPHPSQKVCRHLKDEAFTRGNVPMTKRRSADNLYRKA